MQLTDDDLREFSAIWQREFNEELTIAAAREHASRLLELYAVLAKPLPPDQDASEPYTASTP